MANTKISALTSATTPLAGTEVLPIVQSGTTVKVPVSDLTAGRSISVSGLTNTGLTASKPVFTDASKLLTSTGVVPVANGGTNASAASITAFNNITGYTAAGATGTTSTNLVFSTSPSITTPTLVGDGTLSTGNLIQGTAAKGFNFTANTPASGMSSQLLNWYEEGIWTTGMTADGGTVTLSYNKLNYTRSGRIVTISGEIVVSSVSAPTGDIYISLPFTNSANTSGRSGIWSSYLGVAYTFSGTPGGPMVGLMNGGATKMTIRVGNNAGGATASGFLTAGTTFDVGFTYQCQ
jgi:hypothetical protein